MASTSSFALCVFAGNLLSKLVRASSLDREIAIDLAEEVAASVKSFEHFLDKDDADRLVRYFTEAASILREDHQR